MDPITTIIELGAKAKPWYAQIVEQSTINNWRKARSNGSDLITWDIVFVFWAILILISANIVRRLREPTLFQAITLIGMCRVFLVFIGALAFYEGLETLILMPHVNVVAVAVMSLMRLVPYEYVAYVAPFVEEVFRDTLAGRFVIWTEIMCKYDQLSYYHIYEPIVFHLLFFRLPLPLRYRILLHCLWNWTIKLYNANAFTNRFADPALWLMSAEDWSRHIDQHNTQKLKLRLLYTPDVDDVSSILKGENKLAYDIMVSLFAPLCDVKDPRVRELILETVSGDEEAKAALEELVSTYAPRGPARPEMFNVKVAAPGIDVPLANLTAAIAGLGQNMSKMDVKVTPDISGATADLRKLASDTLSDVATAVTPWVFVATGLLSFYAAYHSKNKTVKVVAALMGGIAVGYGISGPVAGLYHNFLEAIKPLAEMARREDDEAKTEEEEMYLGEDGLYEPRAQTNTDPWVALISTTVAFMAFRESGGMLGKTTLERLTATVKEQAFITKGLETVATNLVSMFSAAAGAVLRFFGEEPLFLIANPELRRMYEHYSAMYRRLVLENQQPTYEDRNALALLQDELNRKVLHLRPGDELTRTTSLLVKVQQMFARVASAFVDMGEKREAVILLLSGIPGNGKSVLSSKILHEMAIRTIDPVMLPAFLQNPSILIYNKDPNDPFDDRYFGQSMIGVEEAFCVKTAANAGNTDASTQFILNIASQTPVPVLKADPGLKGTVSWKGELVVMTSNLMKIDMVTMPHLRDPAAYRRRIFGIFVSVKQDYAHNMEPDLMKRKLNPVLVEGLGVEVYEFHMLNLETGEPGAQAFTYEDIIDLVSERMEESRLRHANVRAAFGPRLEALAAERMRAAGVLPRAESFDMNGAFAFMKNTMGDTVQRLRLADPSYDLFQVVRERFATVWKGVYVSLVDLVSFVQLEVGMVCRRGKRAMDALMGLARDAVTEYPFLSAIAAACGVAVIAIPLINLAFKADASEQSVPLKGPRNLISKFRKSKFQPRAVQKWGKLREATSSDSKEEAAVSVSNGHAGQLNKIARNFAGVYVDAACLGMLIFIGGTVAVMPLHMAHAIEYKDSIAPGGVDVKFVSPAGTRPDFTMRWKDLAECVYQADNGEDLVYIRFPEHVINKVRSIVPMMTDAMVEPGGTVDGILLSMTDIGKETQQLMVIRTGIRNRGKAMTYGDGYTSQHYEYTGLTREGDCGAVALELLSNGTVRLLAMHTYGDGHGHSGGVSLFKSEVESMVSVREEVFFGTAAATEAHTEAAVPRAEVVAFCAQKNYPMKTKKVKSEGFDVIEGTYPLDMEPASLTFRDFEALYTRLNSPIVVGNLHLLEDVVQVAIAEHHRCGYYTDHKAVSVEDALYGFGSMAGVPASTSMGFTKQLVVGSEHANMAGKRAVLGTGRDSKGPCYDSFITHMDEYKMHVLEGRNPVVPTQDILKDEVLRVGKPTRGVYAASLTQQVAERQQYGALTTSIVANPLIHAAGFNPYKCDGLAQSLRNVTAGGGGCFDFDAKCFDGNNSPSLINAAFDVLDALCPARTAEDKKMRAHLREMSAGSYHEYRGKILKWSTSFPSGTSLTIIINGIISYILAMMGLANWSLKKKGLTIREYVPGSVDFGELLSNSQICVCGDDALVAVTSALLAPGPDGKVLNTAVFGEASASFGHLLTGATKVPCCEQPELAKPFTDCEFLKRTFKYERKLGSYVMPLSLKSVFKSLAWIDESMTTTDYQQVVETALVELSLHGQDVYDKYAGAVIECAQMAGVRPSNANYLYNLNRSVRMTAVFGI